MPISGVVTVSGIVGPTSESDTYAVTDPKYGKGGLRTVANLTARDAISTARREEGMLVFVSDTDRYYKLVGGTSNSNWQEFALLPTDSNGNIYISGNLLVSGYIETDTGIKGNTNDSEEYLTGIMIDGGTFD